MFALLGIESNLNLLNNLKRRARIALAGGVLAGVLGVSWAGWGPPRAIWLAPVLNEPAPEQPPEPEIEASLPEKRAVNLLMYRNRDRERLLPFAEKQIAQGDLSGGVETLQRILDLDEDLFLWRKADGSLSSLRQEASKILAGLDESGLQAYDRLVATDAELLWKEACREHSAECLRELSRRYFATKFGFAATHQLATLWFDQGEYEAAARAWQSLAKHPRHRHQMTPYILAKLDQARERTSPRSSSPQPIIQVAATFPVSTDQARLDVLPGYPSQEFRSGNQSWPQFQGDVSRSQTAAATTPYLHPNWSYPLLTNDTPTLREANTLWEQKQGKALKSRSTSTFPIVVQDRVILRDLSGITCLDLDTGETTWQYQCETSLANEAERLNAKHGDGGVHSSRSSSYLQARASYAANSVLGLLSSDEKLIFFTDHFPLQPGSESSSPSDSAGENEHDPSRSNQLVAVPVDPPDPKNIEPVWRVGGPPDSGLPLAGHFFRGPPLPVEDRLYAVTESHHQINLVALSAHTGELLWKQGLAFADENSDARRNRYPLACSLAFGGGVLVCPTQTGLVVGVDPLTGTLLWSYCYAEDLYENEHRGWRERIPKAWGSEGFPAVPKISGKHVFLLPRHSQSVHCLNARTGERIWTSRREDGEFLGAVTNKRVLVVGRRYSRCLSAETGELEWSTRTGLPSGQGIHAGKRYLLPLESGQVATLDLRTGRKIGLAMLSRSTAESSFSPEVFSARTSQWGLYPEGLPENWRPGNFVPAGNKILACGSDQLVALPQAGELLNREIRNRLLASPDDSSARVMAAELQIHLGRLTPAKHQLTKALEAEVPESLKDHGNFLLREVLFQELESSPEFAQPILDDLNALVTLPADRARFFLRKADHQLRNQNPLGAFESARELISLNVETPLPWPRNPEHTIAAHAAVRELMTCIRGQLDGDEQTQLDHIIERECGQLLASGDRVGFQNFLDLYADAPQAAVVRNRMGELAVARGDYQQAEFLWLKNRSDQDPLVAANATWQLMRLWNRLGLYSEAAALALELQSEKYQRLPLQTGETAGHTLKNLAEKDLLREAMARQTLPQAAVTQVSLQEERWKTANEDMLDAFGKYRREFSLNKGSSFQLLDKGWVVDDEAEHPETRVAVIDRTAGAIAGKIKIPLRNSYPSLSKRAHIGHFFPLGSLNQMMGVSLLEIADEEPLWKKPLGNEAAHQHILRVGPAGTDFCTFQGQQELLALNPITGKTLWKRTDIAPACGLVSDPYAGLFGDENVLVLFHSNRRAYTVYSTATGEELHHGELDIDTGQIRRIFGRKLFYVSNTADGRRIRIWDFGANKMVFDAPAGTRVYSALTPDHDLVVLVPPENSEEENAHRLQIRDVAGDRMLLDISIPDEQLKNLNYIRGFKHGDQFYVNLQRSVQRPVERLFSYYASDAFPAVENIQGDLMAVDAKSGNVLWQRNFPQRSIFRMPYVRLPFLVMISRVRDRWQGGKQGLLVEIVDERTGQTLTRRDNHLADRIVNLDYQRDEGILDLNGLKTRIRINFRPKTAAVPEANQPL